jgi:hypothetical protein
MSSTEELLKAMEENARRWSDIKKFFQDVNRSGS